MLRFEEQQEFEAWLQSCPLPSRALAYTVSRRGDDPLTIAIECSWRLPSARPKKERPDPPPIAGEPLDTSGGASSAGAQPHGSNQRALEVAGDACGEGADSAEGAGSGVSDGAGGAGAGSGSMYAGADASASAGAGAAPGVGKGDASAQIASLQDGLGAMKTMLASGGISVDALTEMMGPDGAGGLAATMNPGGGGGLGGAGGGAGGGNGAALAAMLLQQRTAMGDGPGAPPRTDPESIRAVLGICQGFSCPKPPGAP